MPAKRRVSAPYGKDKAGMRVARKGVHSKLWTQSRLHTLEYHYNGIGRLDVAGGIDPSREGGCGKSRARVAPFATQQRAVHVVEVGGSAVVTVHSDISLP